MYQHPHLLIRGRVIQRLILHRRTGSDVERDVSLGVAEHGRDVAVGEGGAEVPEGEEGGGGRDGVGGGVGGWEVGEAVAGGWVVSWWRMEWLGRRAVLAWFYYGGVEWESRIVEVVTE